MITPGRAGDKEAGGIRAVSYNIHHGAGMDGKLDLERIAAVIKAQRPTHVALQEVDQGIARSGKVAQAEKLAELLGMRAVFSKAMAFGGGEYGTAVLHAGSSLESKTVNLPGEGGEPRAAALVATPLPGGGRIWFGSIHIDHESGQRRRKQMDAFLAAVPAGETVVLFGDFNAGVDEAVKLLPAPWARFAKSGQPASFPANAPEIEIDHAFIRQTGAGKWALVEHRVLGEAVASDHRPVLLVLRPEGQ